MLTGTRWFRSA